MSSALFIAYVNHGDIYLQGNNIYAKGMAAGWAVKSLHAEPTENEGIFLINKENIAEELGKDTSYYLGLLKAEKKQSHHSLN